MVQVEWWCLPPVAVVLAGVNVVHLEGKSGTEAVASCSQRDVISLG